MSKISELSDGGVIQGGDTLIAVRSGGNVKVTYGGSTTANIDGGTIDGTTIGGTTPAAGNFTTGSFTGNVSFGDNDKAIFGASSDLQIYHDGNNSYIDDTSSGNLVLRGNPAVSIQKYTGEVSGVFNADGPVNLYYDNALKLATTSTGIDVTGSVTADGLTVDGEGTFTKNQTADTAVEVSNLGTAGATTTSSFIVSETAGTPKGWFRRYRDGTATTAVGFSDKLVFEGAIGSTPTNRMEIASNGDISFYEDTGTTAKLFWDAADESLGIGTTTPNYLLDVEGSGALFRINATSGDATAQLSVANTTGLNTINFGDSGSTTAGQILYRHNGDSMAFNVAGDEAVRILNGGNVEIKANAGSLSHKFSYNENGGELSLYDNDGAQATLIDQSNNTTRMLELVDGSNMEIGLGSANTTGHIQFKSAGFANAMRIDSAGNLLVNQTSPDSNSVGIGLLANGTAYAVRDGSAAILAHRKSSDGNIIEFLKDNTTVGSIGSNSGYLYVGGTAGDDAFLSFGADGVRPSTSAGAARDDAIDLGGSTNRFKDGHFSGNINANTFTAVDGVYIGGVGFANKLDDYEEGTWTPSFSSDGYVFSNQTGTYTKIGRQVFVRCKFQITTVGSNTSSISFSGLPFTSSNAIANGHFEGVVRESQSNGAMFIAQVTANTAQGGVNSMDGISSGDNHVFTVDVYSLSIIYEV